MIRQHTLALLLSICANAVAAAPMQLSDSQQAFRGLYKELIEINTTLSSGSCTKAANAMANRLRASGIPDQDLKIIVPPGWPTQGNMVATLHGTTTEEGPVLLLAHIDVVEANPKDWERDPFTLIEEDGYFFGRGTADDKAQAAIFTDIMIRMSESGYRPERTVKLALTCGEETPNTFNGVSYLLEHHRELLEADFALNEGGFGRLDDNDQQVFLGVQAGEKVYQDYKLETTNPGGHSSIPRPDNAIYQLTSALARVAAYEFPIEFNDTTRAYFRTLAKINGGPMGGDMLAILETPVDRQALARVAAVPIYNSILHTNCITTMLEAGHAPNALPQSASANVNCRIFPGHTQEEIRLTLEELVDDPGVVVTFVDPPESTSPPPPLTPAVMGPIEQATREMWLGVPVLPTMIAGGTDGRFLTPAGIPTYGVTGLFAQPGSTYAHGLNERMRVQSLYEGREFLDRLVKLYVGGE